MLQSFLSSHDLPFPFYKEQSWILKDDLLHYLHRYDPYDGVFVAPQKGVYFFSWTVSGINGSYIVAELVVEQNTISSAGEDSAGGHPSGSMTALCKMEKGDHAWIRTTGVSTGHQLYSFDNYHQSSFLGHLIDSMS
jgi:hypothetical protein